MFAIYLQVLGPRLMENRKPFHLQSLLVFYNAIQVVFSAWLFYEVCKPHTTTHKQMHTQTDKPIHTHTHIQSPSNTKTHQHQRNAGVVIVIVIVFATDTWKSIGRQQQQQQHVPQQQQQQQHRQQQRRLTTGKNNLQLSCF